MLATATATCSKTTFEFSSRVMTEPELDDFFTWHRTPKNIRPTWSKAKGYWRSYKDDEIKITSIAIINPPMGQKYWDVRTIVGSFGPIRDIYQPRHFGSSKPRGVIFVEMINAEDARILVEETNVFYDGEYIRIDYAGPRGRPADFIGRAVAKAVSDAGINPSQPIVVNINYGAPTAPKPKRSYNFNVGAEEWIPDRKGGTTPPPSTPLLEAAPKTPERAPKPLTLQPPPAPVKIRRLPPGLDIINTEIPRIACGPADGLGFASRAATLHPRQAWSERSGPSLEGNKLGREIPKFDLQPGQDDTIWPADPDYKPRMTGLHGSKSSTQNQNNVGSC